MIWTAVHSQRYGLKKDRVKVHQNSLGPGKRDSGQVPGAYSNSWNRNEIQQACYQFIDTDTVRLGLV